MYFLKISLLLFYTSVHVHASNTKKTPTLYNTRKVNRPLDDLSNCICFPEGHLPTVQKLLDPQNIGQERIVIYLYKNVRTKEIKMHIPNTEKQVRIPDIPYDTTDILISVTNELVNSIFHNNPHRVLVYSDHIEKLNPASTDSWPIGLNWGAIEHVYPKDINNLDPNYGPRGNEDNIYHFPSGENGVINYLPNATPTKKAHSNANPGINDPQWWHNNFNHPTNYPFIGGPNDNIFAFNIKDEPYQPGSPENWNNPLTNVYTPFNVWFDQQMKTFKDIRLPHELTSIDTTVLRSLVLKTLSENNIYVNANGVIKDSKGLVIDAANLELRPLLIGEAVDQNILQTPLQTILLPKHLPYLEGILVTLLHPPQVLGIIPLGKTFLPSTSFLGNSKINALNSSNIYNYINGNSVSHLGGNGGPHTVWNKGPGSSYGNKESNSPYYSSNIYKQTLPSSYPSSSNKIEPGWNSNKQANLGASGVPIWSSGPYTSVPTGSYGETNWNPSLNVQPYGERRKMSEVKIKHLKEQPKKKNKKKGKETTEKPKISNQTKVKDLKDDISLEPLTDLNATESGRRFPKPSLSGVMKTLLYLLGELPSRRNNDFNSTEEIDNPGSENLNGGERPDFRIIGGNAATGSGTPLSNKGRSGYTEYI